MSSTVDTGLLRDDAQNIGMPAVAARISLAANEIDAGRCKIAALLALVNALDAQRTIAETERDADDEWRRVSASHHREHPAYIAASAARDRATDAAGVAEWALIDARNAPELQE